MATDADVRRARDERVRSAVRRFSPSAPSGTRNPVDAEKESFRRVSPTCQDVADVLGVLAERYEITDEDVDFARKLIKRLATGRLREALIEAIGREYGDTLTNGCGVELKIQMSGASVSLLYDPNEVEISTADNGVIFRRREGGFSR